MIWYPYVPMYNESMIAAVSLAENFLSKNSKVYDVGCSTGTLLINCNKQFNDKTIEYIGIDSSQPMLDQAKKKNFEFPFVKKNKTYQSKY